MSVSRHGAGDPAEVEALITDRYLDSLLTLAPSRDGEPLDNGDVSVGAAVRAISRPLATDLPRFHPSFRFEERLALRLAQLAASMRLPMAAGGEGQVAAASPTASGPETISRIPLAAVESSFGTAADDDVDRDSRPLLIGGAVAASAISLAGAWLAWRRRTSPISRAARAAHALRQPLRQG